MPDTSRTPSRHASSPRSHQFNQPQTPKLNESQPTTSREPQASAFNVANNGSANFKTNNYNRRNHALPIRPPLTSVADALKLSVTTSKKDKELSEFRSHFEDLRSHINAACVACIGLIDLQSSFRRAGVPVDTSDGSQWVEFRKTLRKHVAAGRSDHDRMVDATMKLASSLAPTDQHDQWLRHLGALDKVLKALEGMSEALYEK